MAASINIAAPIWPLKVLIGGTANAAVLIEWADGNVSLTIHGIASRNGALGERIPVRSDLGKRFEATVVAPGRVRID